MTLTTLCYIINDGAVLMLLRNKKANDINHGKWIGVGGKFLPDESPDDCVRREVAEETGLVPSQLDYRGVVTFLYDDAPAEYMHVYRAISTTRVVSDCTEGELAWIPLAEVNSLALWPGDRIFLHWVLAESAQPFSLKLCYQKDELINAILNGNVLAL